MSPDAFLRLTRSAAPGAAPVRGASGEPPDRADAQQAALAALVRRIAQRVPRPTGGDRR